MKALIWVAGALALMLWTGAAALADAVLGWLVSSGDVAERVRGAGDWASVTWPAAWTQWVPVEWLSALAQSVSAVADATLALWPWLMTAAGWLSPLLWVVWGLGAAGLLALCALGHWLVGRVRRPVPRAVWPA